MGAIPERFLAVCPNARGAPPPLLLLIPEDLRGPKGSPGPQTLLSAASQQPSQPGLLTRLVTFHLFSPRRPGHHSPLLPALLAFPDLRAAASRFTWPWPPASLPRASRVAFTPVGRRGARGQQPPHQPRAARPARDAR